MKYKYPQPLYSSKHWIATIHSENIVTAQMSNEQIQTRLDFMQQQRKTRSCKSFWYRPETCRLILVARCWILTRIIRQRNS